MCNDARTGFVLEEECNNAGQCDAEAGECENRGGGNGGGGNGNGNGNGNGTAMAEHDECSPACVLLLERCDDGECVSILEL